MLFSVTFSHFLPIFFSASVSLSVSVCLCLSLCLSLSVSVSLSLSLSLLSSSSSSPPLPSLQDLHASLGNVADHSGGRSTSPRCIPFVADAPEQVVGQAAHAYIGYPQMMYSGVLSRDQVDGIYKCMAAGASDANRSLTAGVPGWFGRISLRSPFGLAFALLQHDMVERFLLHFYAVSAQ